MYKELGFKEAKIKKPVATCYFTKKLPKIGFYLNHIKWFLDLFPPEPLTSNPQRQPNPNPQWLMNLQNNIAMYSTFYSIVIMDSIAVKGYRSGGGGEDGEWLYKSYIELGLGWQHVLYHRARVGVIVTVHSLHIDYAIVQIG